MKQFDLKGTTGRLLLAFSLLLGISIMSSMTAQAQYRDNQQDDQYRRDRDYDRNQRRRDRGGGRNNDGYGNYGGSFQLRQTALNAGANEGNKAGRKDRQKGERYEFRDESAYQKATKDYSSSLGDREIYRRYFREAFEHGYADGYNGY
jgi:hypothetical protein